MFAVLMMFIIIEENGGEAAGIYFSCKKPGSHHVGENALFTSWSAVMYPITDGRGNKCTFCLHGCGCYLITFVIAIAKAEAFSLSATNLRTLKLTKRPLIFL
ncbi:hypothetical protein [Bacillus atrophaeus]|uniref:hypothetical protein n=1 Tax=Bacillus atrophaeus TaxID=1452 RepID=UPI00228048AE|nr:hypothetical protein [Bacillus atrophaeus]MCY9108604.1 hypothetical protein [Bacillus atrophaeus]MED4806085.1 hypothetical protein [Bacillus atrophaeus]MED4817329.1 hypothetical protein [Bacillus atrophaeus]MED4825493.1 hypothetical protein [Bacillus atrophaeus]MED4844383.1 hypothetical protein [Bacillus atrophaeus]